MISLLICLQEAVRPVMQYHTQSIYVHPLKCCQWHTKNCSSDLNQCIYIRKTVGKGRQHCETIIKEGLKKFHQGIGELLLAS